MYFKLKKKTTNGLIYIYILVYISKTLKIFNFFINILKRFKNIFEKTLVKGVGVVFIKVVGPIINY